MDILICQSCGIIIRSKSKFCTSCGATISRFSPTPLPAIAHTAAPLSVTLEPNPLVLERAINQVQYAHVGGNGGSGGNGQYGYDQDYFEQANYGIPPAATQSGGNEPGDDEIATPQASISTSRLQTILGNAAAHHAAGSSLTSSMSGLISLGDEEDNNGHDDTDDAQSFSQPAYPPAQENPFAPPAPAEAIETTEFEAQGPEAPLTTEDSEALPPTEQAAAWTDSWQAAPPEQDAFSAAPENNLSLPEQAPPSDATAFADPGGGSPTEPEAPAENLTNDSAGDRELPFEPEQSPFAQPGASYGLEQPEASATAFAGSSPSAFSTAIPTAAPGAYFAAAGISAALPSETYSPEQGLGQQLPESPASPAENQQSNAPSALASLPPSPAAVAQPDLPQSLPKPEQAGTPNSGGSAWVPPAIAASGFFTGNTEGSSSADGKIPPTSAGPPKAELPPAASLPVSASTAPSEFSAAFVLPPTPAASTAASEASALAAISSPAPAMPQAVSTSTFSPVVGGQSGSSFDFFAQTPGFPATAPATLDAGPSGPGGYGGLAESSTSGFSEDSFADKTVFATASPAGSSMEQPSIIAEAIRAATAQSQPPAASPSSALSDSPGSHDDLFPDESSNRGRKKDGQADGAGKSDDSSGKESASGKARQEKKKEEEKFINILGKSIPQKLALTAGILLLFVGIPLANLLFGLIGNLGKGVNFNLGGMTQSQQLNMSGRWELGFLDTKGRPHQGTLNLTQQGADIDGWGVDVLPFQLKGTLSYPKLQFNKQYVQNGHPAGKPILYVGQLDWLNKQQDGQPPYAHIAGIWRLTKREGFGWRGQIVTRENKWEAQLVEKVDPSKLAVAHPPSTVSAPSEGGGALPQSTDHGGWSMFFLRIAAILLLIGAVIVFCSLKMFGPAGMLNIWAKKEYIPSQFKSQHFKMVHEFGKTLRAGGLPLGLRADWNILQFHRPRQLALPPEVRETNPHMLLLGAGSKGKSRLMASMIAHDIQSNDRAVVLIDSDGGLVDLMLSWIASHPKGNQFAKRLIVVDPTRGGESLAYNPLEFPDDGDLQNAASAVVFGFKAIYTEPPGSQSQWNQQTANILRNSAILLMANGKTLTDLPVLLSENDFRDVLLEKIERVKNEKAEYTTLLEAWAQYKRLARTDQWINWVEPILNRVQPMLGDPRIRPILTKPKGDLNLKDIISEGKILFVKVPQGQLDQNANLLGSLLVTGLKQATLSLSFKGNSRRHPCALYLDEFDNFIEKETFDAITSETKKFQMGFIGASKTLQGLPEDYRSQIIINVGTMACFALAKKDGDMLGPQMFRVDGRKVKHQTLQNIFNKVNTSPQFELISDEEKLNIDRVVGQEERTYFCYRVGTVAGVFQMTAPEFKDIPDKEVNWTLVDQIYGKSVPKD